MSITVLLRASGEQSKTLEFDGLAGDEKVAIVSDRLLLSAKQSMSAAKWARLISTLQLWTAYNVGDEFAIRESLKKLYGARYTTLVTEMFSHDFAAGFALPRQFIRLVRSSRLVLFQEFKSGRVEMAILCTSLGQALLVRKAFDGLGVCMSCSKTFQQKRTDEMFCSVKCGNRFRQQRRRSKSKIGEETRHGRLQAR